VKAFALLVPDSIFAGVFTGRLAPVCSGEPTPALLEDHGTTPVYFLDVTRCREAQLLAIARIAADRAAPAADAAERDRLESEVLLQMAMQGMPIRAGQVEAIFHEPPSDLARALGVDANREIEP
jgi:hypothetical protein